jgi:hypothetical protein
LALVRANYWKAAEEKVEQLRIEVEKNRKEKENALKRAEIAEVQYSNNLDKKGPKTNSKLRNRLKWNI